MEFEKVVTDSISGDLKVYTQMISVKELMSKFSKEKAVVIDTSNKNEPFNDTQPKVKKVFIN